MFKTFIENRKRKNTEAIRCIVESSSRLSERDFRRLERLDRDYQFWNRLA